MMGELQMKKFIAVLLIMTLVFTMGACGKNGSGDSDLVKVGDTNITAKQLEEYVALVSYISGTTDLSTVPEENMKEIKAVMLDNMIELEVLEQYYKNKEDKVLPKTAKEDLKKFLEESKSQETIKAFLEKSDISDETLTTFFYSQYYAQAFFEEVSASIPTLETDAKANYEKNKESYKVDEIRASHILIGDKTHKAEDKALAEQVLQQIKDGESFEKMASKYNTDSTKNTGGDLNWFGKGQMVPEFETAAYALEVGQLSPVVQTDFGYHIIKLTGKREYKSYEDVQLTIKQSIVDPVYNEEIEKIKKKIGVEYLNDEVEKQAKEEAKTE